MPLPADAASRDPDWETTILSIRQARDMALAREADAMRRLRAVEQEVVDLRLELDSQRDLWLQGSTREQGLRRERDDLQMRLLDMHGEKLAFLESEWKATTALGEARRELAIVTAERDGLQRELEANRHSQDAPAQSTVVHEELLLEVATLRAKLQEREVLLEAQNERFAEEHAVLEAQLLAARLAIDSSEYEPAETEVVSGDQPSEVSTANVALVQALSVPFAPDGTWTEVENVISILENIQMWALTEQRPKLHRLTRATLELLFWLRGNDARTAAHLPIAYDAMLVIKDLAVTEEPSPLFEHAVFAVDDDPDNCECVAMALQKYQLSVAYSTQPERAVRQMESMPCDLVCLDFDMPGMNGIEVFHALRAMDLHAKTPVLFVSALESTKARLEEIDDSCVAFISKPYNLTTLCLKALTLILGPCSRTP